MLNSCVCLSLRLLFYIRCNPTDGFVLAFVSPVSETKGGGNTVILSKNCFTAITGYRKSGGGEFTSALLCQCERIPIDVLSKTGNRGHMGHPPLLCNIQRDLT